MPSTTSPQHLPPAFDATAWSAIEPVLDELAAREIDSIEAFERWIRDRSDLESACSEAQANLYIDMTRRTDDEAAQRAYASFIERVPPRLKPRLFELDTRLLDLAERFPLDGARYGVLLRDTRAEVELFREENVRIQTELETLGQRFGQISGAMTVEFEGRERTLAQMAVYQESTDRAERERAWRAVADRCLADADALDELFDEMVARRDRMASNAGLESFVGYAFKEKLRFDYTPEDCARFHEACQRVVVPFNERLQERRRRHLGVARIRPWDLSVDPRSRPALEPFETGRELYEKSRRVFASLDDRLASMFETLGEGLDENGTLEMPTLDLDARRGKAPGGYQYMRERSGLPFIFMNAAGVQGDVRVMIHEAGHAFHALLLADEPLRHDRNPPIEFCEVASMAMELLAMPHLGGEDGFYPDARDHARAMRQQLERVVGVLSWIATIDAFQHWIYANPAHTREQRAEAWLELEERFGYMGRARPSFEGIDPDHRRRAWQRQLHLFLVPMYYIEYAIAQLGALQLWERSLDEGEHAAVDAYLAGLRLGNRRPLPELFEACGIEFDFGPEMLERLVGRVETELAKLPE